MTEQYTELFDHSFEVMDAAVNAVLEKLNLRLVQRLLITTGSLKYVIQISAVIDGGEGELFSDERPQSLPSPNHAANTLRFIAQIEIRKLDAEFTRFSIDYLPRETAFDQAGSGDSEHLQEQLGIAQRAFIKMIESELETEFFVPRQYKIFQSMKSGRVFDKTVKETVSEALEIIKAHLAGEEFFIIDDGYFSGQITLEKYRNDDKKVHRLLRGTFSGLDRGRSNHPHLGTLEAAPVPLGTSVVLTCQEPTATISFFLIGKHLESALSIVQEDDEKSERVFHVCRHKASICNKYIEIGKQVHRVGGSPLEAYDRHYKHKRGREKVSLPTIKRAWAHYNAYQAELRSTRRQKMILLDTD